MFSLQIAVMTDVVVLVIWDIQTEIDSAHLAMTEKIPG